MDMRQGVVRGVCMGCGDGLCPRRWGAVERGFALKTRGEQKRVSVGVWMFLCACVRVCVYVCVRVYVCGRVCIHSFILWRLIPPPGQVRVCSGKARILKWV